jgi:hypothetical protein
MSEQPPQANATGGDAHSLLAGFQQRMVDGLALNNVLRGSWAEEVVAHFLQGCQFSEQWSFYDFMWEGHLVSVKHSTGPKANFSVGRKKSGWAPSSAEFGEEVFLGNGTDGPQYWCDLFVFAWLPNRPTQETVLDVHEWKFAIATKTEMEASFDPTTKSAGPSTIGALCAFVPGADFRSLALNKLGRRQ